MRIGVKVEKPETYSGEKSRDLDTWLFQVREHLDITTIPARGHVPYAASLLRGNAALWWREVCEDNRRPATWDEFGRMLRDQFRPEDYGRRGRDELATMRQGSRESVADFVARFRATCLRVPDLAEAEKLDRFTRALVQDVRLQVELRGPQNFHDAAMYAERADAVLTRISGQDARKPWSKGHKGGFVQRSPMQNRGAGEPSARMEGGPEPDGIRNGAEEDFIPRGNGKAARRERLLLLQEAQRWTCGKRLSREEKACGKRKESLGITVVPGEVTEERRRNKKLQFSRNLGQVGQLSTEAAAAKKKKEPVDTGELVSVDTGPVKETDEVETADEEIPAGCKLLSIEGLLNGFPVKFLIDSGATDCFVSTAFVEEKKLEMNKRNEKVKINLADGTTRVSTKYVKQACVSLDEHMEFLDFTVINISNYEAILGKSWLDRWNPAINWKENSLQWKMGKRVIKVTGLSETHTADTASSLFDVKMTVETAFGSKNAQNCKNRASLFNGG